MTNNLYSINNLTCRYEAGPTVLSIAELTIPRGELIFIIGVSGGGKSTLLETLGMMNNTIKPGSKVMFSGNGQITNDLETLWKTGGEALDVFRKEHFSFIFQKTNLIPSFSCGENMMLPALFKGADYDLTKRKVLAYMEQLDLPVDKFDAKITEVSGGQRQRLAFIRAMVAEFTVLFGDEPTGNLDRKNAVEVMTVLKNHLETEHKTGIVVSHDTELAKRFAHRIIRIVVPEVTLNGGGHGTIRGTDIFLKREDCSDWVSETGEVLTIEDHLKSPVS